MVLVKDDCYEDAGALEELDGPGQGWLLSRCWSTGGTRWSCDCYGDAGALEELDGPGKGWLL